jgi:hypothetical protein
LVGSSDHAASAGGPYYLLRGNVRPQLTGAINLIEHYKLSGLLKDRDKIPPTFEPYIRHLPVMGNETDANPALGLRALFPLDEWPIVEDDDDLAFAPLGPELLKGLALEPGKLEERKRRKKHRDKDREGRGERKHRKHRKKHRGDQQVAADGSVIVPADGSVPGSADAGAEGSERRKHRHKHKRKSREEGGAEGRSTKESREERRKKRRKREQAGSESQSSPTKPPEGAPAAPAVVG